MIERKTRYSATCDGKDCFKSTAFIDDLEFLKKTIKANGWTNIINWTTNSEKWYCSSCSEKKLNKPEK